MKFDEVSDSLDGVQVLFKKKRDDVFTRLFGAYALVKDESGMKKLDRFIVNKTTGVKGLSNQYVLKSCYDKVSGFYNRKV